MDDNALTKDELELLGEILFIYRDQREDGMSMPELAELQSIADKLDAQLDAIE